MDIGLRYWRPEFCLINGILGKSLLLGVRISSERGGNVYEALVYTRHFTEAMSFKPPDNPIRKSLQSSIYKAREVK